MLLDRVAQLEELQSVPVFCGNSDEWQAYFEKNIQVIDAQLGRLKDGLDQESRDQVELFYRRYRYVFPPSEFERKVYFDRKTILTEEELQQAEEMASFLEQPIRYKFPERAWLGEPHLFWSKVGLRYVPEVEIEARGGRDVIDGGAYCGDSSLVFTEFPFGKVHAFEVFPDSIELLEETISLNEMEGRIIPVPKGLGSEQGKLRFWRRVGSKYHKDLQVLPDGVDPPPDREEAGSFEVTTIDDYVAAQSLTPGLIKLDVEGHESAVIKGSLETIRKYKPILLLSIYHNPRDFFDIKPLLEEVRSDYQFRARYLNPCSPANEFMLIAY